MINKDVGERIKLFRQEVMHMTQKELAAKLGINAATMNRIENGYRMPDHGTYALLATRTVAEILGHRTLQMVMRYAHLSPEHLRQAVDDLGEILFSGEKQV